MYMSAFSDYFRTTSELLMTEYARSTGIDHNLTAGEARELFLQGFLNDIYPGSFVFGGGEILDSDGNVSRQADVVIYDDELPVLDYGGSKHFLAEGVRAHLEVKSDFSSNLSDPLSKTESVKKLNRYMYYSEGLQRNEIFSALFSYEGPSPETFARNFYDYYSENAVELDDGYGIENTGNIIDLVCVLDKYVMFKHPENGISIVEAGEDSLEIFFVYLAGSIFKFGRGHPDLARYMEQSNYSQVEIDLESIFD